MEFQSVVESSTTQHGRFQADNSDWSTPPPTSRHQHEQQTREGQAEPTEMPICIECRYPVGALYTTYSKADDKALGKGVRLTQCPRCKRFADKYVEHDFVVLFIDLVLIKPQVCCPCVTWIDCCIERWHGLQKMSRQVDISRRPRRGILLSQAYKPKTHDR
jgi:hypothetical protein